MKKLLALISITFVVTACNSGGTGNINPNNNTTSNRMTLKSVTVSPYGFTGIAAMKDTADRNGKEVDFAITATDGIYLNNNEVVAPTSNITWKKVTNLPGATNKLSFSQIKACGTDGSNPYFVTVGTEGLIYTGSRASANFWNKVFSSSLSPDINLTAVACSQEEDSSVMIAGYNSHTKSAVLYSMQVENAKVPNILHTIKPPSSISSNWNINDLAYGNGQYIIIANLDGATSSDSYTVLAATKDLGQNWAPSGKIPYSKSGRGNTIAYSPLFNSQTKMHYFVLGTTAGYLMLNEENLKVESYWLINSAIADHDQGTQALTCNQLTCLVSYNDTSKPSDLGTYKAFNTPRNAKIFDKYFAAGTYSKELDSNYLVIDNQVLVANENGIVTPRVVTQAITH